MKNSPFIICSIILLAIVAALELITLQKTGWIFCYPLDDTFIHMAVAKNTAVYGNWGISPGEFVSTSSAPLFTAMLALCYKMFGLSVYTPFVLSMAGALLLIFAMQVELNRLTSLTTGQKIACILITLFVGAIPSLAGLGMEHTFQVAFTLMFVHTWANIIMDKSNLRSPLWSAALWGACMVFTRYENAFVVAAACGLLFLQKRYKTALIIGFISAFPIILFGLYAVSKGGLFIPNSIQIKVRDNYKLLMNGGLAMLEVAASISGLLVLAVFYVLNKLRLNQTGRSFWILAVFVISGLLHSVFGGFGWFYRYEAYLIVLGGFHLLVVFFQWFKNHKITSGLQHGLLIVVAILFTFNLPLRGMNALRNFVRSTYNIYEQQYQMGLFISKYYDSSTIAANDIGAISYMSRCKIIDLWGLGNNEVTVARKGGYWNSGFLQSTVTKNNAAIAVVYESWFDKELTDKWVKTGTWEVSYSFMLGDTKVTFYAINPGEAAKLRENLKAFAGSLPKDIKVEILD